jgi:hypothetical protein
MVSWITKPFKAIGKAFKSIGKTIMKGFKSIGNPLVERLGEH